MTQSETTPPRLEGSAVLEALRRGEEERRAREAKRARLAEKAREKQTLIGSECRVDAADHSGVCPSRDPCTSGREPAPYAAASTTTSAATTTPSPTAWGTL